MLAQCMTLSLSNSVMENVRLLGDRVTQSEESHRHSLKLVRECNTNFRNIDKHLNAMRPDLMRLQWEKDQYTRYLVQANIHDVSLVSTCT